MVRTQAPVMSVVVEKRLPVSVFCAVTVTPGRGMFPLLTMPCTLPPDGVGVGILCATGSLAPDVLTGATGWVAGNWARAARPPAIKIPAETALRIAFRRIHAP